MDKNVILKALISVNNQDLQEATMLFTLALIPVVGLLVFIYFKDRKEKEPFWFLVALFFGGMATVVTAILGESLGQYVMEALLPGNSVLKQVLTAIFVVGFFEELGKFLVLRIFTWKSKNFNYSYDSIVYAVFISLGFAAFENVMYVFSNGFGTAILRMITAVPGHACFAVFMGFFYSKAKYAALTNKKGSCFINIILAMVVPMLVHGIYDAILMGAKVTGDKNAQGFSVLVWIGFVIVMFVVSFILVHISAKHDFCIISMPDKVQTMYRPNVIGTWTCVCGSINRLAFCPVCGKQRPTVKIWYCPKCGTASSLNFCGNCGTPKPSNQVQANQ